MLLRDPRAVRGDIGRCEPELRVGRGDPCFGGFDRLQRRRPAARGAVAPRRAPRPRPFRAAAVSASADACSARAWRSASSSGCACGSRPARSPQGSGANSSARTSRLIALTFAMIGMVRKDRRRPEQLLGKHRSHQQVRPGRRTEREEQVRTCRCASSWPSAAPIRNRASRLPPSRQRFELLRQLHRRERLAALVEHDRPCRRLLRRLAAAVGQARSPWSATRCASDSARRDRLPGERPIFPRATMWRST